MRVRVNPFLRVVPDRDCANYRIADLLSNAEYHLPNPEMLGLLGRAREWTDRADLERVAGEAYGLSPERARSVVDSMLENDFLVDPEHEAVARWRTRRRWADEDWGVAFDFLACIRDYPYYRAHDYESAMERVSSRAERAEVPPVYRSYDDCPREPLPPVEGDDSMPSVRDVLGAAGGDRRAAPEGWAASEGRTASEGRGDADVDRQTLSTLLYYTFGETGRQELPGVGEFLLKTSPSGGGRHPVEAYVAAVDVPTVPTGLYHYSVEHHALERLAGPDGAAAFVAAAGSGSDGGEGGDAPAVAIGCTAVVARNMWKYRDPRAYRIPFHDVGHLVETLRLCCAARGLAVRFGAVRDHERWASALAVDPLAEPPLCYALVGTSDGNC